LCCALSTGQSANSFVKHQTRVPSIAVDMMDNAKGVAHIPTATTTTDDRNSKSTQNHPLVCLKTHFSNEGSKSPRGGPIPGLRDGLWVSDLAADVDFARLSLPANFGVSFSGMHLSRERIIYAN
jgi:hypothetical protein